MLNCGRWFEKNYRVRRLVAASNRPDAETRFRPKTLRAIAFSAIRLSARTTVESPCQQWLDSNDERGSSGGAPPRTAALQDTLNRTRPRASSAQVSTAYRRQRRPARSTLRQELSGLPEVHTAKSLAPTHNGLGGCDRGGSAGANI